MACINDSPDGIPQNQRSRKNRIYVHAGTKDMSKESSLFDEKGVQMFSMHKAFVKYDPQQQFGYDIGILRKPFLQGSSTMKQSFYSSANQFIAPICLGSEKVKDQFDNCHLTTVGWGLLYNANPEGPWDDNIFTYCTTNGVGPVLYRYKECDLDFLKETDWECPKNDLMYPENYKADQCKELYEMAHGEKKQLVGESNHPSNWMHPTILKNLENADKLEYIKESENIKPKKRKFDPLICYKDEYFRNQGWCVIKGYNSDEEWGFCDTSCKHVKVNVVII